jgi:hypothetical protein
MAGKRGHAAGEAERGLTERQRHWLRHLQACERSGETIRRYGERQGLSIHSLYSARKRLRGIGFSFGTPRRTSRVSFAKVGVREASVGPAQWRVHFPNGAMVEWDVPLGSEHARELLQAIAHLQ